MPTTAPTYADYLRRGEQYLLALMRSPAMHAGRQFKAPVGAVPVLAIIARADGEGRMISQADIKEMTGLTQSSCQRVAVFLEARGLVSLERDPQDGRKVNCRLTPRGHATMWAAYEETIREPVPPVDG
jgi:DNA-binding MarR family transcriptional regulator